GGGSRIIEIGLDRQAGRLVHGDDPHHQEEGHHRGDEIGVRHLPGSPLVAAVAALLLDDANDWRVAHGAAVFRFLISSSIVSRGESGRTFSRLSVSSTNRVYR